MNTLYDVLSKNITESEKSLFGNLVYYDAGCVRQSFVTGFSIDVPYALGANIRKNTTIDTYELMVLGGLLQERNVFIVERLGDIPKLRDCIKILPFKELDVSNIDLLYNITPGHATIEGSGITILPYSEKTIKESKSLKEAIVRVNHLIQIILLIGKFGITLPVIIEIILGTLFPKSHYTVNYQNTSENNKFIQVSSGKTPLFEIELNQKMPVNLNIKGVSLPPFSRLIKLHNLSVSEINSVGLFIYLITNTINAIVSKQTIYTDGKKGES